MFLFDHDELHGGSLEEPHHELRQHAERLRGAAAPGQSEHSAHTQEVIQCELYNNNSIKSN